MTVPSGVTVDPEIVIEERRVNPETGVQDFVRYRRLWDGRRWEVHGECDRRGDCLVGAVIEGYGEITSHEDIEDAKRVLGVERLVSELDVPVSPEFHGCCPFRYVELGS